MEDMDASHSKLTAKDSSTPRIMILIQILSFNLRSLNLSQITHNNKIDPVTMVQMTTVALYVPRQRYLVVICPHSIHLATSLNLANLPPAVANRQL